MPSRRSDIAMTQDEMRLYLANQPRLIIVSNGPDGYPHPMPMNFIMDAEDRFVVTTFRKSQKVVNLTRDPRAALLVESGLAYHELKTVLAYADAEIIDDPTAVQKTMDLLARKQAEASTEKTQDMFQQAQTTAMKRVVLRFKPHHYISWDHSKLGSRY